MTSFLTSIVTSTSLFPPKDDFPPNRIRSKKSKIKNQHRFRALTFLIPILRKKKLSKRLFSCKFFNIIQDMIFFSPLPSFGKKIKDPDFLIGTDFEKKPRRNESFGTFLRMKDIFLPLKSKRGQKLLVFLTLCFQGPEEIVFDWA